MWMVQCFNCISENFIPWNFGANITVISWFASRVSKNGNFHSSKWSPSMKKRKVSIILSYIIFSFFFCIFIFWIIWKKEFNGHLKHFQANKWIDKSFVTFSNSLKQESVPFNVNFNALFGRKLAFLAKLWKLEISCSVLYPYGGGGGGRTFPGGIPRKIFRKIFGYFQGVFVESVLFPRVSKIKHRPSIISTG